MANFNELYSDLIRKIRQQRGVHDVYLDKYRLIITIIKIFNIFFSGFITLIVFADFGLIQKILPEFSGFYVMLSVGIISFIIFILNSIVNIFSIENREVDHRRAIELFSDLLRDLRKIDFNSLDDKAKETILNQFNDRYMQVTFSIINIGGKKFESAQAKYLRRQARRMARKENPFLYPWQVRKKAINLVKEWKQLESKL